MIEKIKAALFVYAVLPYLNRKQMAADNRDDDYIKCPCCGKWLQFYKNNGYLHAMDGDADCYGALGYGKGKGIIA